MVNLADRAATDRVASGLTGIRIGRRNRGYRGGVLDNRDRVAVAPPPLEVITGARSDW